MNKTNKFTYIFTVLAVVVYIFFSLLVGGVASVHAANPVFANETTEYSDVLVDLKTSADFDENSYVQNSNDNSLQLIEIAESVDKSLFVYVYQPSGQSKNLTACSINISTTIDDDLNFVNYKLQLINSNGVFFKYSVVDFIVLSEKTRYYAITTIFRPFDETLGDKQAESDNIITEVEFKVAKQYCFEENNGNLDVSVLDTETIEITDKFVGFVRYVDNGWKFYDGACDSHFVAFNTDKPIDKLLEADIYFEQQNLHRWFNIYSDIQSSYGEIVLDYAYLNHDDDVEYKGSGWFSTAYNWKRIETIDEFFSNVNVSQTVYSGALFDYSAGTLLTEEAEKSLKGYNWVLRFAETPYTRYVDMGGSGAWDTYTTLVSNVSILRLKFETDGKVYNLGVIDNKQTGSSDPVNDSWTNIVLNQRGKWILGIIAGLLLLLLFAPILPYIIRFIVWLVSVPFKSIGALFKGIGKAANKRKRGK